MSIIFREAEQREKSGAVGDTANGTEGATAVDMDRSVQLRTKSRSKRKFKTPGSIHLDHRETCSLK